MSPEPAEPTTTPQTGWRAILRIGAGIALILVGIVGLILPIMPGWIFIIPGLVILADYFRPVRRLVDWAKAKYEAAKNKPG